jgi:hypothetical protein
MMIPYKGGLNQSFCCPEQTALSANWTLFCRTAKYIAIPAGNCCDGRHNATVFVVEMRFFYMMLHCHGDNLPNNWATVTVS